MPSTTLPRSQSPIRAEVATLWKLSWPMLVGQLATVGMGVALLVGWILGLAPAWFPWSPARPMAATGFWIGLVLGLTVAAVLLAWSLQRLSRERVRQAS